MVKPLYNIGKSMKYKNLFQIKAQYIYLIQIVILVSLGKCTTVSSDKAVEAYENGNYDLAIQSFGNPSDDENKKKLAISYFKVSQYQKSFDLFKEIKTLKDKDYYFFYGEAARCLQKLPEAVELYRQGLLAFPQDVPLMKALAWTLIRLKEFEAAKELLTPMEDPQAKLMMSNVLFKQKNYHKSQKILEKIVKVFPKDSGEFILSSHLMAENHRFQGRCNQAIREYQGVLKKRPLFPASLIGLGVCLWPTQKNKAITHLEKAIRVDPSMAEGYYYLGKAFQKKNPQKSLFFLKRFLLLSEEAPNEFPQINEVKTMIGQK